MPWCGGRFDILRMHAIQRPQFTLSILRLKEEVFVIHDTHGRCYPLMTVLMISSKRRRSQSRGTQIGNMSFVLISQAACVDLKPYPTEGVDQLQQHMFMHLTTIRSVS